jgi:hypothetical protein
MADNEHVVVGYLKVVALLKRPPPGSLSGEQEQRLAELDYLGQHRDGFVVVQVQQNLIPELRDMGAEVIVIAEHPNEYVAMLDTLDPSEMIAQLDQRVTDSRTDLALAEAGRAAAAKKA